MRATRGRPTVEVMGPRGIGPPLMTWKKGQPRELADGGGLCSPGKWPLNRRRYENGEASSELRAVILKALDSLGDGSAQRRLVFELAAGRFGVSPFPEEMVSGVRRDWAAMLAARGHPRSPSPVDMPQSIDMRLLEAVAAAAGDPDAGVASQAAKGVRTGILSTLPRTPAIFEAKSKWPLPDESDRSWSGERSRDNYISAAERPDVLRRQFDEEVEQGMMEKLSLAEARRRWGQHLVLASLGAIVKDVEKDEWRIIHDASHHVHLNHRIRIRDQARMPAWQDVSRVLEEMQQDGHGVHFVIKYDVSKAHRRVPIVEEEWGLLACRASSSGGTSPAEDETVYVNKVGTFGVSSAGYWWARVFALVIRILFWLSSADLPLYHLVYSDDGILAAAGPRFEKVLLFALFVFQVLGVPLTWRKVRGGIQVDWVGYVVNVKDFQLGLSARRLDWAAAWCSKVAAADRVSVKEVQEGLGRLVFVAGPLAYARPFLGPLFAWVAACPLGATLRPPKIVRLVLRWFARTAAAHPWKKCRVGSSSIGETFRIDAKAEGPDTVVLGGWCTLGTAAPGQARWFSHKVARAEAPWAFEKGQPQRAVAALELLAVLYGVALLVPPVPGDCLKRGSVEISVGTDNQSNSRLANKWITTKLPLALVAMELATQLADRHLELDLKWRRRDLNQEADALTNSKFEGFDPALRVDASRVADSFSCLHELNEALTTMDAKPSAEPQAAAGPAKRGRLREREPW